MLCHGSQEVTKTQSRREDQEAMYKTLRLCLCVCLLWRFVALTEYSNEWIIKSKLPKSTIEALGQRHRLIYLEQVRLTCVYIIFLLL